ncbi:MAG TPA: TIGR04283 family arsenosugar biosynthesis glycosyltransferase [Saprospiraceae bacterium]|nr:TIGR04283 family arsenosugar biosynthesis glycosyltransferase [Saprospiraceae bacterium]
MAKISLIIPVLNEATNLAKLLPYLIMNGKDDVGEVLVVDGGSTDGSQAVAESAGALVLASAVRSRAAQMNLGARHARFEILYFVHADTWPPSTFATDILQAIASGIDMGCYRYRFDSPGLLLRFNAFFNRYKWLWCQGGDKTFFIPKEKFLAIGGYDEQYVVMEEYDFLRRALPRYSFRVLPQEVIVSARKYRNNSWLRVQLANMKAFSMFRRGVPPAEIRSFYKKAIL